MVEEQQALANDLLGRALDGTDHPDRAVSVLMTAGMTILQRRFGAEQAIEYMTAALDSAGAATRAAIRPSSSAAGQ